MSLNIVHLINNERKVIKTRKRTKEMKGEVRGEVH
jgi:hypothetical protein